MLNAKSNAGIFLTLGNGVVLHVELQRSHCSHIEPSNQDLSLIDSKVGFHCVSFSSC